MILHQIAQDRDVVVPAMIVQRIRHVEPPITDSIIVPFKGTGGNVVVLIVALDYDYVPAAQLTCSRDARTMYRIAERAGVKDITVLTDKQGVDGTNFPVRSVVLQHIRMAAGRCRPGDWFVWFWAGHGVTVRPRGGGDARQQGENADVDTDGDQAFVTPDQKGALTERALLMDDVFATALDLRGL
ncbi:unnamed protein product [Prorocentrum cordatum]|uniref:Uncharacterized protein n=1 Tax=Prorocentrum cordatum TaxID=2364126 RepID=A0ABN9PFY7_9DINO|nr:unnamed protein product [Polarella glacialis]